jgi:hypothetical protein
VKIRDHVKSKVVGEIIFLDLYSIKLPKKGVQIPKPQWIMRVDEAVTLKIIHVCKEERDGGTHL